MRNAWHICSETLWIEKNEGSQEFSSSTEGSDTLLPRKASKDMIMALVPRTNTRGQGENPKASETTMVKELCKIAP